MSAADSKQRGAFFGLTRSGNDLVCCLRRAQVEDWFALKDTCPYAMYDDQSRLYAAVLRMQLRCARLRNPGRVVCTVALVTLADCLRYCASQIRSSTVRGCPVLTSDYKHYSSPVRCRLTCVHAEPPTCVFPLLRTRFRLARYGCAMASSKMERGRGRPLQIRDDGLPGRLREEGDAGPLQLVGWWYRVYLHDQQGREKKRRSWVRGDPDKVQLSSPPMNPSS